MNVTDVTASMVQTLFQTAAKQSASVSLDGRAQYTTARWGVVVLHIVACMCQQCGLNRDRPGRLKPRIHKLVLGLGLEGQQIAGKGWVTKLRH